MMAFLFNADTLKVKPDAFLSSNWFLDNILMLISIIIAVIIPIMLYCLTKRKTRPTMSHIEIIFDELSERLLFTIISHNPSGSQIGKLFIAQRFLKLFFIHKQELNYQVNDQYLNPIRGAKIPQYKIQNQETFIVPITRNLFRSNLIYKLTFSTSDGTCSKIFLPIILQNYKSRNNSRKHSA